MPTELLKCPANTMYVSMLQKLHYVPMEVAKFIPIFYLEYSLNRWLYLAFLINFVSKDNHKMRFCFLGATFILIYSVYYRKLCKQTIYLCNLLYTARKHVMT